MQYYFLIPFAAFFLNSFFALHIYSVNRFTALNRSFVFYAVCLSCWMLSDALGGVFVGVETVAPVIGKFGMMCWIPSGFLYLNFVLALIERKRNVAYYVFLVLTLFAMAFALFTPLVIEKYTSHPWGILSVRGPFFFPVVLGVVFLPLWYSFVLMAIEVRQAQNAQFRRQLKTLMLGFVVTFAGIIVTEFVLPRVLGDTNVPNITSVVTIFLFLFIGIAIHKYNFLSVNVENVAFDLFGTIENGVIITNDAGYIIKANRKAKDIFRITAFDKDMHVAKFIEGYSPGDEFQDKEVTIKNEQEGKGSTYLISQSSVKRGKQVLVNIIILMDISERKAAEESLRESRKRFQDTVEFLPEIFCEINLTMLVTYINKKGFDTLGYTQYDFYERGIYLPDLIAPEDKARAAASIERVFQGEITSQEEFRIQKKDGTRIHVLANYFPVYKNGKITGFRSTFANITALKKMEEELKMRTFELEVLNKLIVTASKAETLTELAKNIVEYAVEVVEMDKALLLVFDGKKNTPRVLYGIGIDESMYAEIAEQHVTAPDFYRKTVEQGEHVFTENCRSTNPTLAKVLDALSFAVLPIRSKRKTIGLLLMANTRKSTFHIRDIRLLLALTDEAANALSKMIAEEYTKNIEKDLHDKKESILSAQTLQRSLTPKTLPRVPNINIASCYIPSQELGGDFFDIKKIGNNLVIIMADCVGHGIEASMAATLLKSISDRYLVYLAQGSPEYYIERVNRDVVQYFFGQSYPTMFACVIDLSTYEMAYTNANSPRPYIISDGKFEILEKTRGFLLGYEKDMHYERKTRIIRPGEIVFFYSDALLGTTIGGESEALLFDIEDVKKLLLDFGKGLDMDMDHLLKGVSTHAAFPLEDDTTTILVQVLETVSHSMEISRYAEGTEIVRMLERDLAYFSYDHETLSSIVVAFDEMYVNGIEHGNKKDPAKKVRIEYTIDCEKVVISVEDEGEGFDPSRLSDPTDIARLKEYLYTDEGEQYTRGRGVWITKKIMDRVTYNERGNKVTVTKYRPVLETRFTYEGKEETPEKPRAHPDTSVYVWHAKIDPDTILSSNGTRAYIDFHHKQFISSMEIGKILVITKRFAQENRMLCLVTQEESLKNLLREMNIFDLECVSLVDEVS